MQMNDKRLNAVREAYWNSTPEDSFDLDALHDALLDIEGLESPSRDQQKALFMMLPEAIIGSGISWGFRDTEVRDEIHGFVAKNMEAVVKRIAHVNSQGKE